MERQHIEIHKQTEAGFKVQISFESWRIGLLRAEKRFIEVDSLERHLLTDEAFALLRGKAALITRNESGYEFTVMESGAIYNVPQGLWHNILVSDDADVIVVENADTEAYNSEYEHFDVRKIPADIVQSVRI